MEEKEELKRFSSKNEWMFHTNSQMCNLHKISIV